MTDRRRLAAAMLMGLAASACRPNPRSEIAAVAEAGLAEVARTAPGGRPCVQRVIAAWQPPAEVGRRDPPAPPGFEQLTAPGGFRGGGGLKGAVVGGVRIGGGRECYDLRGPLVEGDRAMIELDLPGIGLNLWMRRMAGDWRVVMTTTSEYGK